MAYQIKELFYSLQGEGMQSGRPAVFCRFSGCNLWSGREADRACAPCSFCDTDFRGTDGPLGGVYPDAATLSRAIAALWPQPSSGQPWVICTGGEPLLQLDVPLIRALHDQGFQVAVETNGTLPAPPGIDWLCVSPKGNQPLALTAGTELKLVYPQPDAPPARFASLDFQYFFLQPMDGPERAAFTRRAVAYCKTHPQWRLSLQLHKLLGIP